MEVWPGRPFPLGATWDGGGTNFSLFSEHAERVELCLFDEDGDRDADRDAGAPGAEPPLLPARGRPGPALRLPGPRSLRPARGSPLQPGQAADRPLRQGDRGHGRLGPRRQRAALCAHGTRRRRRPGARRRGRRRGDAQVGGDRRRLRVGGRPAAAGPVRRHGDLRDPRQGLHDEPPGVREDLRGHLRRAGLRAGDRLSRRPRRHRGRAAPRPPHLRRVVPGRAGPAQLLGLQHDRLLRAALRVRRHRPPRRAGARVQGHGQGAAPGRDRGDPRRRLQPHRRGQPPRTDAVVQGRRQRLLLPARCPTTRATTWTSPARATRSTRCTRASCG